MIRRQNMHDARKKIYSRKGQSFDPEYIYIVTKKDLESRLSNGKLKSKIGQCLPNFLTFVLPKQPPPT